MFPIDFFWRATHRFPNRPAVITEGRWYSFAQLAESVASVAAAFQQYDPAPGSRVGIGAPNSYEHLVGILACLASGKIWVPLNPRSGTPALRAIIEFTEPSLLLLDEGMGERVGDMHARVISLQVGHPESIEALMRAKGGHLISSNPLTLDQPQAIKFTGGTTGMPKGVIQPYRSWNTTIVSQWHAFDFSRDDRFLLSAPLTHGSSTYLLPILGAGGCLVFPQESKAAYILEAIVKHDATTLFAPPTMLQALVEEKRRMGIQTPSLSRIIYGGSPMLPERIAETLQAFGPILATTYGQTEAPQIITALTPVELALPQNFASVGRPSLLTSVKIAGSNGAAAGVDEVGEILVRGDLVMSGYWRMPEKTQETIINGWLHTGDMGQFDERGYLFVKGRNRDVIITGGFNVYPSDVEAAIVADPAICECCVVGIPDPKWGEAVHAAITLNPGFEVDKEALIQNTKSKIGSVMTPKTFHIFERLPRTAVDKIPKNEVQELVRQRLEQ